MSYRTVLSRSHLMGLAMGLSLLLVAVSCSTNDTDDAAPTTSPAPAASPLEEGDVAVLEALVADGPDCDLLDARACLLPFPSDVFTSADDSTDTGRRIDIAESAMPINSAGTPIDPAGWAGNDGFSPGTPMFAHLAGPDGALPDLETSSAAPIGDIARSMDDDSPVVVFDLTAGERVPTWVELDTNAEDDADRLLIIRPARNLREGHRHAVAIRNVVDEAGEAIEPSVSFRAYRDNRSTEIDEVEARRADMEDLFDELSSEGIARDDLQLAWSFTVASQRNISERILAMRDDALDTLGDDGAPAFTVIEVEDDPEQLNEGIARIVTGTFTVPLYLEGDGAPGTRINDTVGDWLPEPNGTADAIFACQVPTSALDEPAGPVVYGHGLLGSHREVRSGHVAATAAQANLVYCATDWWGMAAVDLPNAVTILSDLGQFPSLADRGMQGIVNTVLLGRLVRSDAGLVTDPAFRNDGDAPVIVTGEAYYDGNSQGGIMGGAATAISTEWTRAVIGVPGMNYSTLLRRSVDFVGDPGEPGFEDVLIPSYPDPVDQNLGYGLIQMLWDRAETNGYAAHLTDDPLEGTPAHTVILHVAFGDHQVAQVTTEVMARTAGIGLRWPALDDGRHPDVEPYFGLDRVESFPTDRSLLVYWDSGTLAPPEANISPTEGPEFLSACDADPSPIACVDPHEDPRRQPAAIVQKEAFFRPDGVIIDPCDGVPCQAVPRSQL